MGVGAAVAGTAIAGTIASSAMQSSAASKAGKEQENADNAAIAQQQTQLAQEQANAAPYMEAGAGALGQLSSLYGISTPSTSAANASKAGFSSNSSGSSSPVAFTNAAGGASAVNPDASFYLSPDFNFTLTQGLKGLTTAGAAQNGTQNGAQDKAEIQYAGNLASGQYSNYVSQLQSLAGLGANTATNTNSVTAGTSNSISSGQQTLGSNQSSAALGQGQIESSLLSNLTNTAGSYLGSNYNKGGGFGSLNAGGTPSDSALLGGI